MKIKDLKQHPKNPRKISGQRLEKLKASIIKFGDLSGFVYNVRTKRLISGHQRQKSIPADSTVKVEQRFEKPTKAYTIAEGYVMVDGERFKYREVDAPEKWETEAMLAANKHSGSWDNDVLKVLVADFEDLDFSIAGFEAEELKIYGLHIPEISLRDEVNDSEENEEEESDEEYVRNTPETTEEIHTEAAALGASPFEKVEEKMDVVGKRHVIIIDCASDEVKQKLKSCIREEVEKAGAHFF